MLEGHEVIVFAIEHYNPLDLIRSLGEGGVSPIYIAEKGASRCSSMSRYIKAVHHVSTVEEGFGVLKSYAGGRQGKKPIVLTTDDRTQSFIDARYDEIKDDFILFNAGFQGAVTEYMDKYKILKLAEKCGLEVPDTRVVARGDVPDDVSYPLITKSISPVVGGWKSDVFICENASELRNAFEKIQSPQVLLQRYIDKKNEYCIDGLSVDRGSRVLCAIASTYNYNIKGYYSPYMTVAPCDRDPIVAALEAMMEEIGYEGIFEAEFLIGPDGVFYFSEINFRNSTWSYAATCAGMNLAILWCKAALHGPEVLDGAKCQFMPFKAMVEPIDYQKRVVERGMSLEAWVLDVLGCECRYYYNKEDMEPFFQMIRDNEKLR